MNRKQFYYFLLGQVGIMSLARFFFQWIIKYSTLETNSQHLFAASLVGAVLLGFRLFDGFTDPLAGALSDYWVSLGKKRKQILLYSLLLPGLGLILCFSPTAEMSNSLRWLLLVSGMFIFFIGYTFYAIPYWSLIDDYSEGDRAIRRKLSNLKGAGLLIATAIGFIISPFIVEKFGFFKTALIFAGFASIGMLGPYYAEPISLKKSFSQKSAVKFSAKQEILRALKGRRFIALILLLGGSQMSLTIMTAAAPFIAVELLQGNDSDVALLLGPLLCAAFPCFLFAPKLSKKFGWEKVLLISSLLLGIVYCLCAGVGVDIFYSEFATAMILFALGGPMVAMLLALEGEAITDCAKLSANGSVSTYFGLYNFAIKALNGVAIFITGILAALSQQSLGITAIRFMIFTAGGCLFLGIVAYMLVSTRVLFFKKG